MRSLPFRFPLAALSAAVALLIALPLAGEGSPQHPSETASAAPFLQSERTADIVVDFGDGRVEFSRVPVDQDSTGLSALEASGHQITQSGGAVCAIGKTGCPADNCFCACTDLEQCRYWAYFQRRSDGNWEAADAGAQDRLVNAGDVEGWAWGTGLDRPPPPAPSHVRAAGLGMKWLRGQQLDDGSLGGHAGVTSDAVIAARATGIDAGTGWTGETSAMEFLATQAATYAIVGPAHAGKMAAAIAAGGGIPSRFGSVDLVQMIMAGYDDGTGRFGHSNWDQAWAMIGLAASGEEVPAAAVARLSQDRTPAGGWGVTLEDEPDPDSTGLALQALTAGRASPTAPAILEAVAYLRANHLDNGAWGHAEGEPSTNSTALVIQGLLAIRENPLSGFWESSAGIGPVAYVVDQQLPDGRFEHEEPPADLMATVQVVPALAGHPVPIAGRRVAGERAARWILTQRNEDGSFHNPNAFAVTLATVDAVLALRALDHNPNTPAPSGRTAADYLKQEAPKFAGQGTRSAARLALGAVALGYDPRSFGGVDTVAAIMSEYDSTTGAFGRGSSWNNAWAILGLGAAKAQIPDTGVTFLKEARNPEGGWGSEVNDEDVDAVSTGLALQALSAAGVPADDPAVWRGVEALRELQRVDGAFVGPNLLGNPEHTARALGGLVALDQYVQGYGWSRGRTGRMKSDTPVDALIQLQNGDGSFSGLAGASDPAITYVAALGLALRPLPLSGVSSGAEIYLPSLVRGY